MQILYAERLRAYLAVVNNEIVSAPRQRSYAGRRIHRCAGAYLLPVLKTCLDLIVFLNYRTFLKTSKSVEKEYVIVLFQSEFQFLINRNFIRVNDLLILKLA